MSKYEDLDTRPTEKLLYPCLNYLGVATLLAEEMLLEAVPGVPPDAEELQEAREIKPQQYIMLVTDQMCLSFQFSPWVRFRCFILATAPPADDSMRRLPIGVQVDLNGSPFILNTDPPLPIRGCYFWSSGVVSVRIQKPTELFDHSKASFVRSAEGYDMMEYILAGRSPPSPVDVEDPTVENEASAASGYPEHPDALLLAVLLGQKLGESDEENPLVKFSLDIPSNTYYGNPTEFIAAIDKLKLIIQRARQRYGSTPNAATP
ncbi:hypothetical protein L227DRAFT_575982 [Lentinus tigrinus ALCF2SS1-6]|uniref:Uncharacterized protein n=1 Tax=Lentinus tigrinus ALCF2SS1-6 TaxID=1328759 RepID=A0A5C2S765_9APHY|nr:hypothetical protein L227DRAFT_575982 [Lentinus tigrinus ALCF2SS1-6]